MKIKAILEKFFGVRNMFSLKLDDLIFFFFFLQIAENFICIKKLNIMLHILHTR